MTFERTSTTAPHLESQRVSIPPGQKHTLSVNGAEWLSLDEVSGPISVSLDGSGEFEVEGRLKHSLPFDYQSVVLINRGQDEFVGKVSYGSGDIQDNRTYAPEGTVKVAADDPLPTTVGNTVKVTADDPLPTTVGNTVKVAADDPVPVAFDGELQATTETASAFISHPMVTIPAGQSLQVLPANPKRDHLNVVVFEVGVDAGEFLWTSGQENSGLPMTLGQSFSAQCKGAFTLFNSGSIDARVAVIETEFA